MSVSLDGVRSVVNVGVSAFADAVEGNGGSVVRVEWAPPGDGDERTARALALLLSDSSVDRATEESFARFDAAEPVLTHISTAGEAMPDMRKAILHAGPPVAWKDMCGPMKGAVLGAVVFEGWADTIDTAQRLLDRGGVSLEPCHSRGAVGPMAGVLSPSMPVFVVENSGGRNTAFSNLNEGLGRVLRFGANDAAVLERLSWMASVLGPVLSRTLERHGPLELKPLMAQALQMGDELHNRNIAATSLLLRRIIPALLECGAPERDIRAVVSFMAVNDHFFLNLSMAACKAMLDAAHGVPGSLMVTAMTRNGVEFGVRVSGAGDSWFTADAPYVEGLYFAGYGPDDAARDLGDSAITETAGLGGFAMAAAPAIVGFVGGTPEDAIRATILMREITIGQAGAWKLPALGFAGSPSGIDARLVADTGIVPVINTGIAHRKPGIGQIGAGIVRAPMKCFADAVRAAAGLADTAGRFS